VAGYFAGLPSAQQPTSGFNKNGRGYPDVAMLGAHFQFVLKGKPSRFTALRHPLRSLLALSLSPMPLESEITALLLVS